MYLFIGIAIGFISQIIERKNKMASYLFLAISLIVAILCIILQTMPSPQQ